MSEVRINEIIQKKYRVSLYQKHSKEIYIMLDFKGFFFMENFITSTYYCKIHRVSLLLTLRVTPLPLLCRRNPLRRLLRLQWPLKIPPQFLLLVLLADPSLLSLRSISIACSVSGCCVACPSSHPYDQNIARVLWCV